jgi:aspartyl aminopeptidase
MVSHSFRHKSLHLTYHYFFPVECYGGGIWSSWFDRELSLAGRIIIRSTHGQLESRLLKVDRPVLRIPSLCIHLRTAEEREVMKINKEDHLMPVLCDEVKKSLSSAEANTTAESAPSPPASQKDYWREGQANELIEFLANELSTSPENIVDFELSLYDTQNAAFSGLDNEYIVGSRIDNLASCYVALESFLTTTPEASASNGINMIALFDHEVSYL